MLDLLARKLAQLGECPFLLFSHACHRHRLKPPDHSVNGVTWNLFRGTVETWTVLSFVAPSEITSFSQDLKPFFTFLTANQGVPANSFLVQLQAGTEPFVGALLFSPHFLRRSVLGKRTLTNCMLQWVYDFCVMTMVSHSRFRNAHDLCVQYCH